MNPPTKMPGVFTLLFFLAACSGGIQQAYWSANTSVGFQSEKEGNLDRAEIELRLALNRAKRYLAQEDVSDSLYNLGQFYKRQERMPEAIQFLSDSLQLEETLSGPASERTGRRLAELSIAYLRDQNYNDGRPFAERLRPLLPNFTGQERVIVETVLGEYFKKPEDYAKEIAKLESLANHGDAEAQCQLAAYYEDGRGVTQDHRRARELYLSAAGKGYLPAQYYLGVIYEKGRGVPVDESEARKWYRMAADGGHKIAQYNYAVMLAQGRGGPTDKQATIEWLRKSSAQGYPSAAHALKLLKD
jgi:TPR repeat protein